MDIASKLSKYWKYIGQCLVSPLTKSDIEYVILAGSAIVASATRLDSTLSQELPHALARVMAHATRLNARLALRKCDRPRRRQSTAC